MKPIDVSRLAHVDAVLNYLEYRGERPAYFQYAAVDGAPMARPGADKHTLAIYDLRAAMDAANLDDNGFVVLRHTSATRDFFDTEAVTGSYYRECAELVKAATGASLVRVFDHNVRDKTLAQQPESGIQEPVRFVHNDYTETSGPQRVRDLMGAEAAAHLLQHRYLFINVWRPLRGPVLDVPLAVCDAATIASDDFVATDLNYAERTGEVYSVRHNPAHRWFYLAHMQPQEVLLLKCFDSARDTRARYTAHSAFRDPGAPADAPTRQSIEVRTIAFFAPAATS